MAVAEPEEITRMLAPLDNQEQQILRLRFGLDRGEPRTLEEVATILQLSPDRIRQIEARALEQLRAPPESPG